MHTTENKANLTRFYKPDTARRTSTDLVLSPNKDLETKRNPIQVHFASANNLIPNERKADFLKLVAKVRSELLESKDQSLEARHKIIANHFGSQAGAKAKPLYLIDNDIVQQFVEDSKLGDYTRTAKKIDLYKANFVLGEFKIPYNPDLKQKSLEAVVFEREGIKPELANLYPSNAVAVTDVHSTKGFAGDASVSYFRENMIGTDGKAKDANAYYFVDKFLKRIENYSFPTLRDFASKDSFSNFRNASKSELQAGIANWLSTHEFFHADEKRSPLPKFLRSNLQGPVSLLETNKQFGYKLKDKRLTGAFEELRVDVQAMLETFDRGSTKTFGFKQDSIAREMILSERLIRYAVMDGSSASDVASSHVLFNYFRNFHSDDNKEFALSIDDQGKLVIGSAATVKEALEALSSEMLSLEKDIAANLDLGKPEGMKEGIERINHFMLKYANAHVEVGYEPSQADLKTKDVVPHGFFNRVKNYRKTPMFKLRQMMDRSKL